METGNFALASKLSPRYFDAEAGGVLAASVSDVIRSQFQYVNPEISK